MAATEPPCRVSADLREHQRREDAAADEICDQCGASLFGNQWNPKWKPSDENWLICPCGNALCEDCCIGIRTAERGTGLQKWLGWETTHNEGFCSPGCMADRLRSIEKMIAQIAMEEK